eukprot:TRINITY_DN3475_c0_g1_i15.p1 TRINITY_DN3475_c0_g1~~TRINITY_DN3475_c0_g1_i15.p1  ORF type:complete len:228 (+),score=28.77 TRINITY_DN3475_c0_g1_i15:203-886(+)
MPQTIIAGSLHYVKQGQEEQLHVFGMDYNTMTPVSLTASGTSAGYDKTFTCTTGIFNFVYVNQMTGTATITGDWENSDFSADCATAYGVQWKFRTHNTRTPTAFYSQMEAAHRAKYLVGQSTMRYGPTSVVFFAINDYAYYSGYCSIFLREDFPVTSGPEPGAIMVAYNGAHCGIVDNEGTKFVHSNGLTGYVSLDFVSLFWRYFPSGVIYKKYPTAAKPEFISQSY